MSTRDCISHFDIASLLFRSREVAGLKLRGDLSTPRNSKDGVDILVFDYGDLHRIEILIKALTPSSRDETGNEYNYQMVYGQKDLFSNPKKQKGKKIIRLFVGYSRQLDIFLAPSETWFETAENQGSIFTKKSTILAYKNELKDAILFEQYSRTKSDEVALYKACFYPENLREFIVALTDGRIDTKTFQPLKDVVPGKEEAIGLLNLNRVPIALSEKASSEIPKNLRKNQISQRIILTGPPGTGKTFAAKEMAFAGKNPITTPTNTTVVQFHPSYSYPQFVEGLYPTTYFDGRVLYQVVDGILMICCRRAMGTLASAVSAVKVHGDQVFFHVPIGTFGRYSFRVDEKLEFYIEGKQVPVLKLSSDCFIVEIANLKELIPRLNDDSLNIKIEFRSSEWGTGNVVLIVDEINRGNVPEIFGELLYSLSEDADTPTLPVRLQFSQTPFTWPQNLSIIATMNASDRSTGDLDQALRRRFKFIQVNPEHRRLSAVSNAFQPSSVRALFKEDPFKISGSDAAGSCDFAIRCANYILERSPQEIKKLPLLSSTLERMNSLLQSEKFGVYDAKEKLIGHSFYIKMGRLMADIILHNFSQSDPTRINDKTVCYDVSRRIINLWLEVHSKEILPQLKSILSNDQELIDEVMNLFVTNLGMDEAEPAEFGSNVG